MIDLLTSSPQNKRVLAEALGWYTASGKPDTRSVETAIQQARLEGSPILSSGDGYWLARRSEDVDQCAARLRRRAVTQLLTARALRRTAARMRDADRLLQLWVA